MQKIRAQGRVSRSYRIGKGGGEAEKRKKPHKRLRRDVENMGGSGGKGNNVDKKELVQKLPTQTI